MNDENLPVKQKRVWAVQFKYNGKWVIDKLYVSKGAAQNAVVNDLFRLVAYDFAEVIPVDDE